RAGSETPARHLGPRSVVAAEQLEPVAARDLGQRPERAHPGRGDREGELVEKRRGRRWVIPPERIEPREGVLERHARLVETVAAHHTGGGGDHRRLSAPNASSRALATASCT